MLTESTSDSLTEVQVFVLSVMSVSKLSQFCVFKARVANGWKISGKFTGNFQKIPGRFQKNPGMFPKFTGNFPHFRNSTKGT